jgi:XapX domain-containing protein
MLKAYLASLATGLLVGLFYGLISVRSPAPPTVALLGLFGILGGERVAQLARLLIGRGFG